VDGVLASDQSDWFLDDIVPASWHRHLPAFYGAIIWPGRLALRLLGPALVRRIDATLGITFTLRNAGRLPGLLPAAARGISALALRAGPLPAAAAVLLVLAAVPQLRSAHVK
jgi:hypothetical protein